MNRATMSPSLHLCRVGNFPRGCPSACGAPAKATGPGRDERSCSLLSHCPVCASGQPRDARAARGAHAGSEAGCGPAPSPRLPWHSVVPEGAGSARGPGASGCVLFQAQRRVNPRDQAGRKTSHPNPGQLPFLPGSLASPRGAAAASGGSGKGRGWDRNRLARGSCCELTPGWPGHTQWALRVPGGRKLPKEFPPSSALLRSCSSGMQARTEHISGCGWKCLARSWLSWMVPAVASNVPVGSSGLQGLVLSWALPGIPSLPCPPVHTDTSQRTDGAGDKG